MLKIIGSAADGTPAIALVLVDANLARLKAGQPIDAKIGLEIRNRNGGRRTVVLNLVLAYGPTHEQATEVFLQGSSLPADLAEQLRRNARVADERGLDVQDHRVEPFDA